MLGNNLPQPSQVVSLYKSKNIGLMRLYSPDGGALNALRGSGIQVLLDVPNENLQNFASSPSAAANWVQTNVRTYSSAVKFRYIAVGNEVIPGNLAQYVLGAMKNIKNALGNDLGGQIKVSTSVSMAVIGVSYPPSHGAFSGNAMTYMGPIVQYLASTNAPLLVNVYPYFSYKGNPNSISLQYATFTSPSTVVQDGSLNYQNLFDAMVDSVYAALSQAGGANVPIVVSESGWPSDGGFAASVANAGTYNANLVKHVGKGTPRKPGPLETYVFAMFNENQKTGDPTEQHFGLFYPNQQPVYPKKIFVNVDAQTVGVCYGMLGDNLPQPSDVVNLYKSNNIGLMRLYSPDGGALNALRGSGIQVLLDVPNENLQNLASSPSAASDWVQTNVRAYSPDIKFRYIAVGNEVIPGNLAQYVLGAMKNIKNALGNDLGGQIKVSTSVSMGVIGVSYPPSHGAFSGNAMTYMGPIVQYLASTNAPLLVNVYPYFSYKGNPNSISLQYATFTSPSTVVQDGSLNYQNLFDAMVDSVYAALSQAGGANVPIVVSESGWPSDGGFAASVANAGTYNANLVKHVGKGTPRKPGPLETYVFAMFNENQKTGDPTEQHFGLFYPSQRPVYPVSF
ncbi:Glucan endo-1,3-beta-glucosidase [Acorus gramineus]|uniref:Glucan endo-1,3-beta-glucosidase n=1 Tax=Acorus gramineus TaxID=55184 RepID=A0AAV9BSK4_ACOGR|nr:Glucan endo-1,3-beta-glucosidase [Acorus gramineus]